jgi:hypothetical protein
MHRAASNITTEAVKSWTQGDFDKAARLLQVHCFQYVCSNARALMTNKSYMKLHCWYEEFQKSTQFLVRFLIKAVLEIKSNLFERGQTFLIVSDCLIVLFLSSMQETHTYIHTYIHRKLGKQCTQQRNSASAQEVHPSVVNWDARKRIGSLLSRCWRAVSPHLEVVDVCMYICTCMYMMYATL